MLINEMIKSNTYLYFLAFCLRYLQTTKLQILSYLLSVDEEQSTYY